MAKETPMTNNTQLPAEAITPQGALTTVYVPCHEDDPRICGCYTSLDGQNLCYVRESTVPVIEQGAAWVNGAPKERKQHIARVYSFINEEVSYDAIIWPIEGTDHWWAIGNGFKFSVHKDKIVEWLDETPAEQPGKLTQERADLIREVNNRDLEGVNTPNNDHHY